MKLIIKDDKILSLVSDSYNGEEIFIFAPEWFTKEDLPKYRVTDGSLVLIDTVVPTSITPRQGRIVLSQYGLLSAVDGYFAALTGDGAEIAKIEWEYAQEWRRDWLVLVAAATSLGLTTEQIDQMFIAAVAL